MSELVFDIETVADNVSEELEKELLGKIEPTATAVKKGLDAVREYMDSKIADLREGYALSPMTGKVLCICGIMDGEEFQLTGKEKKVIESFMDIAVDATRFITFNGKQFDVPFLNIRMAKLGVASKCRIPSRRYDTVSHFDVREVLTNFGMNPKGSLKQWAKFFNVEYAQDNGSDIANLSIEEVVEKCLSDCRGTQAIYDKINIYY